MEMQVSGNFLLSRDQSFIRGLELVVGRHRQLPSSRAIAFTKWCPQENGDKSYANAEAAVNYALKRMGQKEIDLLQCKQNMPPKHR